MPTQTQLRQAALLQNAIITCIQKSGSITAPDAFKDPQVNKLSRDTDHVSTTMSNLYYAGMLERKPAEPGGPARWAYVALDNPRKPIPRNIGRNGPNGKRVQAESADFTIKVRIGDKVVELTFDQSRDLYRQLKKLHGGNDG